MEEWEVKYSKESKKFLKNAKAKVENLVIRKIHNVKDWLENTEHLTTDIKKLKDEWEGFYRIRVGPVRVIITFDTIAKEIRVHAIGQRSRIYKKK